MNRLLAANFMRLKKSKVFWLCMLYMAVFAGLAVMSNHRVLQEGGDLSLEDMVFTVAPFIGIVAACFVSLFVGTEYSDGTIRNKVIIGHSRTAVYLSNLITSAAAGILMYAVYLAVYIVLGIPEAGWFGCEPKRLVLRLVCMLILSAAFASIFTLAVMLNQNKAVTAVISILLAFGILFAGTFILTRLSEPEYYEGYIYITDDGTREQEPREKNPKYLEGTKREVYAFFNDFLPGGQQMQLAEGSAENPGRLIGYSAVIIVVTTAAGIFLFRRKDLK